MTDRPRRLRPLTQPLLPIATGVLAAVVGLTAMGGGIAAATGGGLAPPAVSPATVHAPTAHPDRVILTPTETPSSSQHVTWRTSTAVATGQAQITAAGIALATASTTVEAEVSTVLDSNLGYQVKHHTATFTDLEPDTAYLYRVGDGETWSEWFEFRTASDATGGFSFIVQGDGQNDNKAYSSRAYRAAFEARPYAKLALHAGDLIDTDIADNEWGEWHEASGFANQYLNTLATPGNHEYYPGPGLTPYWGAQFEFPQNGPAELPQVSEAVYSVDYQGVRFISLDSNLGFNASTRDAQTAWLEAQLADNPNQWTVVTFHHPVFAVTSNRDNAAIREAWMPLLEAYGVDLVVQGHDHAYGRGNLLANEAGLENGSHTGPVYLVSVAGPKMYVPDAEDNNNWINNGAHRQVVLADTQLFQTVDVTDDQMHVQARTVTGEVVDSFTVTKLLGGEGVVTNEEPWIAGPGSTREGIVPPGPTDPDPTDPDPTDPDPTDPTAPSTPKVSVSDSSVAAGGAVGIDVSGFDPGERLLVELHSNPVELLRTAADSAGALSARVAIPANTPAGAHQIVVTGLDSGKTASIPLEVLASGQGGNNLATTGAAGASVFIAVGVLLLAGGAFLLVRHFRKPASEQQ